MQPHPSLVQLTEMRPSVSHTAPLILFYLSSEVNWLGLKNGWCGKFHHKKKALHLATLYHGNWDTCVHCDNNILDAFTDSDDYRFRYLRTEGSERHNLCVQLSALLWFWLWCY